MPKNITYRGKKHLYEHFTFEVAKKINPGITMCEFNKIKGIDTSKIKNKKIESPENKEKKK